MVEEFAEPNTKGALLRIKFWAKLLQDMKYFTEMKQMVSRVLALGNHIIYVSSII